MGSSKESYGPPEIVIIGGGIVGLILATGLHRRSIPVTVYEQASSFRESGAGIGFNIAAKSCMEMIDPAIITALRKCGGVPISAADPVDPHDYLRWVDGYTYAAETNGTGSDSVPAKSTATIEQWQKLYLKLDAGYKGIEGTRRDHFLEELGKLFDKEMIHFNKQLKTIVTPPKGGRLRLEFEDGTSVTADAVVGCDGIRSRTRDFILNPLSPPCKPSYAHVRSYRALLPMSAAVEALGPYTASIYHNHIGPGANLLHYPVAQNALINVAIFLHDPEDWPEVSWTAREAPRSDAEAAFKAWHPRIQKLISMLPETLSVFGVFDLYEYPLPHYNADRICVAGDAAHASSPHHGAGAGMGIEDSLCLSVLLSEVDSAVQFNGADKATALAIAFETYNNARRNRSQWLVNSSRRVCDLQHSSDFGDQAKKLFAEGCFEEIKDRTLKIWNFDHMGMCRAAVERFGRAVNQVGKSL